MRKKRYLFFITALLLLLPTLGWAADQRNLRLVALDNVILVPNSLYNHLAYQDARNGFEQNQLSISEGIFASQLNSLLLRITEGGGGNKTLLFLLRNLCLNENDRLGKFAHMRVSLFEQRGEQAFFIGTVDKTILLKSEEDVDIKISQVIAALLAGNLTKEYTDEQPYDVSDLLGQLDYNEKQDLQVYHVDAYQDGVYTTFADFAAQTPTDEEARVKFKKGQLKEVKILQANGKLLKLQPANTYAVVVNGQPYVATDKKFLRMYKNGNDFYFEDIISSNRIGIAPSLGIGIGAGTRGYGGGGLGIGIYRDQQKKHITYKIDALTGDFIPVDETN